MNFLSFVYFLAVANADSIRSAADSLHISQQALSEQVRRLEEELQVKLITKTRPAKLTPCGEHFAKYCTAMLNSRKELDRELADMIGQKREIVVSVEASSYPAFLSELIEQFTTRQPGCSVTVKERPEYLTDADLQQYDFNFSSGLLSSSLTHLSVQGLAGINGGQQAAVVQKQDKLVLLAQKAMLRRHWKGEWERLLRQALETPNIALFQDIPFICLYLGKHLPQNNLLLFAATSFSPKIAVQTDHAGLALCLCQRGTGALIVPENWLKRIGIPSFGLEMLQFDLNIAYIQPDYYVSYDKSKQFSVEEQVFFDLIGTLY